MRQIAASWAQGKIDVAAHEREKHNAAANETRKHRWIECPECQRSGPYGGLGLCRKCYKAYRKTVLVGRCGVCKRPGDRRLASLDPPVCIACRGRRQRQARKARDPEGYRETNARNSRLRRERHPEARAKDRAYHRRYYADPEHRARKIAADRARNVPRGAMSEEDRLLARAADRARYAARKAREALVTVAPTPTPPVLLAPPPPGHLPEDAFAAALAARREEKRPEKKYRRRKAA